MGGDEFVETFGQQQRGVAGEDDDRGLFVVVVAVEGGHADRGGVAGSVLFDLFDDVAVTSKPVLKGQLIDASAVRYQKHNVARLKNGYFAKSTTLQPLEARRNLARGAVLTPRNLTPRLLVRAGQQVTLVISLNGLQVKSTGKALQSARLGEVVRVRNSQSLKIVEGVVSGNGLVEVSI